MKLEVTDIEAIAKRRWKSRVSDGIFVLWLVGIAFLMIPFGIIAITGDMSSDSFFLLDGQLLVVDNGQATIGNILLEEDVSQSKADDQTLLVVLGVLLGVWLFAGFGLSLYDEGLKANYCRQVLQHWADTRELPEGLNEPR